MGINLGDLALKNPVIAASGTFGYGQEYKDIIDLNKLGAITTKTITLKPRTGNPQPRIIEVKNGIINSIGLQNDGIDYFIKHYLPFLKKLGTSIIVSIAGETPKDYAQLATILNSQKGISALEVNISCPNVKKGCMIFGKDPKLTDEVVRAVRNKTNLPLIVKLTPNTDIIDKIASAAENAGADIISMINTVQKKARIPGSLRYLTAGLSGPAIKATALCMIKKVHKTVNIPIIGMGGIMNIDDAKEFFAAGAEAIAIGTAIFIDPKIIINIIDALESE